MIDQRRLTVDKKNKSDQPEHPAVKSSMSVSQEVACEDADCIREASNSVGPTADETVEAGKKKPADSSMAIGGKEICSDDACIGKD